MPLWPRNDLTAFPLNQPSVHRNIRKLHLDTCDELGVEAAVRTEVDRMVNELQQLLIGISIMQVGDLRYDSNVLRDSDAHGTEDPGGGACAEQSARGCVSWACEPDGHSQWVSAGSLQRARSGSLVRGRAWIDQRPYARGQAGAPDAVSRGLGGPRP